MLFKYEIIKKIVTELFFKVGYTYEDANIISDILLDAEASGVTSHGISMVSAHIRKSKLTYNIKGKLKLVRENDSYSVFDADNMIGLLSAYHAMEYAISKAKKKGCYAVFCNNANTFSAASYYSNMAINAGLIGVATCNAPAQMTPIGGKEKLLGTNPIAIGVPSNNEDPFLLDMATSIVAKSKINEARDKRESIPYGWALDSDGEQTCDPQKAIEGSVLPMAGAKGYGLSMAIDLIAGLLSGASYQDNVVRFFPIENGCMNVGHAFFVLDPAEIYGESFYEKSDEYFRRIRGSMSSKNSKVYIPGDNRQQSKRRSMVHGIEIDDKIYAEINSLAKELEIAALRWGEV